MHLRTILAIARKDAIDMFLNKSTASAMAVPIVLALLFLLVSRLIGGHTTNLLVYNPDHSPLPQMLSRSFEHAQITEAASADEVTAAFGPNGTQKEASYDVGLIIPPQFEASLQAGRQLHISLYVNGSNISVQDSLLLQAAITNYARQVAAPQPPVTITSAMINPPSSTNVGDLIGKIYTSLSLLMAFVVGISLMPALLIEEKEKKTLRMLMVTPASFLDVLLGKLLIVMTYQLLLSLIVLSIQGGWTGRIELVLLYILLGACLSLTIGLLIGSVFQTASAAGAFGGMLTFLYIVPAVFAGPLGNLIGNSALTSLVKLLPTYYIMDGLYNALQSQGTPGGYLLDAGVLLGSTALLLALTAWVLRRQSAVAASI